MRLSFSISHSHKRVAMSWNGPTHIYHVELTVDSYDLKLILSTHHDTTT